MVKSRDLHWGLLATRDHKEINLSSLRSILVADGANPWSLSSCDQFASIFQSRGLRPNAVCPCAGSSETGTVSLRRFGFFFFLSLFLHRSVVICYKCGNEHQMKSTGTT